MADRSKYCWDNQTSAASMAVKYAAEHPAMHTDTGTATGFFLYGSSGLNAHIGLPGLRARAGDFDFVVLAGSLEQFVEQTRAMLDFVNCSLDRPMADVLYPVDLVDMAQLVIGRKALVDMKWMRVHDFDSICERHGLPVRAPESQEDLRGCLVAPAAYLESLLVTDPDWPMWRLKKTVKQQEMVKLAKQLGVWCVDSDVAESVVKAVEQARAAAGASGVLAATLTALPNDNRKVAAAQEETAATAAQDEAATAPEATAAAEDWVFPTAAQESTAAAEDWVFHLEQKLESETGSLRRMSELENVVDELRYQLGEVVSLEEERNAARELLHSVYATSKIMSSEAFHRRFARDFQE